MNPSLQKVVHFLRAVIFNPHCLSPFFPYFALFPKNFSPSKIYFKKKMFPPKQTEIHALKQDGFLTAQPMRQPQSFFCKHRGKSFKVCCRHRTAGLGSMKSGLLHRYTQVGGNIRKVVRTPFHIFVPSDPVDGRKYGLVRSRQKYKNSDFQPVVPMYHIRHHQ